MAYNSFRTQAIVKAAIERDSNDVAMERDSNDVSESSDDSDDDSGDGDGMHAGNSNSEADLYKAPTVGTGNGWRLQHPRETAAPQQRQQQQRKIEELVHRVDGVERKVDGLERTVMQKLKDLTLVRSLPPNFRRGGVKKGAGTRP